MDEIEYLVLLGDSEIRKVGQQQYNVMSVLLMGAFFMITSRECSAEGSGVSEGHMPASRAIFPYHIHVT